MCLCGLVSQYFICMFVYAHEYSTSGPVSKYYLYMYMYIWVYFAACLPVCAHVYQFVYVYDVSVCVYDVSVWVYVCQPLNQFSLYIITFSVCISGACNLTASLMGSPNGSNCPQTDLDTADISTLTSDINKALAAAAQNGEDMDLFDVMFITRIMDMLLPHAVSSSKLSFDVCSLELHYLFFPFVCHICGPF